MNYIKQIQQQIAEQQKQNEETREMITDFMIYLSSEKFQGFENNYVNANEAYNMLATIKNKLS
jgi:hypothetical protein